MMQLQFHKFPILIFVSLICLSCSKKIWQGRSNDHKKWLKAFPTLEKAKGIEYINTQIRVFDMKKHETVADVGGYDGTYLSLYSLYTDSVNYIVEDVDSGGFRNLPFFVKHFESLKGTPNTNTYKTVLGEYTRTNLRSSSCDKILIIEAFHHFSDPVSMLTDIKQALKKDGILFIEEPIAERTKLKGSEPRYCRSDFLGLLQTNGFKLVYEEKSRGRFIIFKFVKAN